MYRQAITAFAVVVSSGVAHAQSADKTGWYAGIDIGRSRLGMNGSDVDGALANQGIGSSTSLDQTDTGLGINGGYRFNNYFALEGAYQRLDSFDYNAPPAATRSTASSRRARFRSRASASTRFRHNGRFTARPASRVPTPSSKRARRAA